MAVGVLVDLVGTVHKTSSILSVSQCVFTDHGASKCTEGAGSVVRRHYRPTDYQPTGRRGQLATRTRAGPTLVTWLVTVGPWFRVALPTHCTVEEPLMLSWCQV